jgi:hypothetical protein
MKKVEKRRGQVTNSTFEKGYSHSTFLEKVGQKKNNLGWPNIKSNSGQVTLFIVLAILLVVVILVFFFYVEPTYISDRSSGPKFDNCVRDVMEQSIDKLSSSAGYLSPEFTFKYNGEDLVYLCYTNEYYKTCTVQQPFLKQNFENELEKEVRSKIDLCYQNSLDELKAQGYEVTNGVLKYDILFEPGIVRIEIDAPTTVGSQSFKKFNVILNHPIYDTVMIATSIIQSEAHYGDADTTGLMLYYPDYIIDKLKQGEGTTVYIIQNKLFNYKFKFVSRSLAWPAGYLGQQ